MPTTMNTYWIPEAPEHPGLYANESGTDIKSPGKIQPPGLQPSTMNAFAAKRFKTLAECQSWCDANPSPVFVPREHGIEE